MSLSLTLDALLFHMIGGQLKRFAKARKDLLVAVNETVRVLDSARIFSFVFPFCLFTFMFLSFDICLTLGIL